MELNFCRDCLHWHVKEDSQDSQGVCGKIEHVSTIYRDPPLGENKAHLLDGEGFSAFLVTTPDFGCTLHQPKE